MSDQTSETSVRPPKASVGSTRRLIVLNGLGLIVIIVIALIVFWIWHQGYYFYSTDDAMVTGAPIAVAPSVSGSLIAIGRTQGSAVRVGDTIATVRTADGSTVSLPSPINGAIVKIAASPGALVAPGQAVAEVVDLQKLSITAYVEETHISDIAVGEGVDVRVDAIGGRAFQGTVSRILPVAADILSPLPTTDYAAGNYTKVTQRIPVQITLDTYQGHTLYPGSSAEVTIHLHS